MTEALNYTTKAIADLSEMAAIAPNEPRKRGLMFLVDLLRRAEVFILPERGQLLDRGKPYPEVPASIYRPPFPVVALEFASPLGGWQPTSFYNSVPCSRRISLAWDWDGRTPLGIYADGPAPGEAVAMASLCYYDQLGKWVPVVAAILARYDAGYVQGGDPALSAALARDRGLTAEQLNGPKLDTREVIPLLPDMLAALIAQHGERVAWNTISADLMDEVNAYRDMCLALACNNVTSERCAQPPRLNRARIKAGKPPLKDFHVLTIGGEVMGGNGDGAAGHSVRSHLRRGHIRRLGPERITWVNSCMVRGSRQGLVDKQYALRGRAEPERKAG